MSEKVSVKVKHVMSSPVVTVGEGSTVLKASKLMDRYDIGSLIVVDKDGNPLGMITDMDIIKRVIAKNLKPRRVKVEEVMSKPLITIDQDADLATAARVMRNHRVKRLGVMYKGKLIGIISSKDIVTVTPELIEIITEKERITGIPAVSSGVEGSMVGYCELCGEWSDSLVEKDGKLLCESCLELE
ncbi:MAG: CBS domain-containing protein [Nitrososphaerota archaeon]|nr:CBS domain-containing protein [Candidatus Bathyarchaeota archaeon]MCX8162709.1 CBS domain-containing protein [Candidatus Bathyarchaeota archaeon]MDW8061679.1 CBS domain-containing protein [Nitrososphaerota archaeon]